MKNIKCLSGATLKHIALITMLMDHTNKAILFQILELDSPSAFLIFCSDLFSILGRIAFPIFCFLLVEGFFHTGNKANYLRNLMIFAAISEIPFDMFLSGRLFYVQHQNVFFTLTVGFLMMWGMDAIKEKTKYWHVPAILLIVVCCIVATMGEMDYRSKGILVIALFYLLRTIPLGSLAAFLPLWRTPWAILGFLPTLLYNGARGKQWKWFNYWFYPAHLLILGILRIFF